MLTPLNVTSSASDLGDGEFGFERLMPLPAPSFLTKTPQTKADETHLKRQTDSMGKLKIRDWEQSGDESGYDSSAEPKREREGEKRIYAGGAPSSTLKKPRKSPGLSLLIGRNVQKEDEVVESMSPGGHVNKRRARSRPVSAELLAATPAPRNYEVSCLFHRAYSSAHLSVEQSIPNSSPQRGEDSRSYAWDYCLPFSISLT
jgi:mitosis inhibitor protein kinase SWE1